MKMTERDLQDVRKRESSERKRLKITPFNGDKALSEWTARLPADAQARKNIPLSEGCLDYFPDALAAVAELSKKGNDQHNPGEPLHWSRSKSGDHANTILRHMVDRGTIDTDKVRHSTKVAWRALAQLQIEIEEAEGLPISRGSTP